MKQLLTVTCVGCKHVASVTSDNVKLGVVALASTLAEHVRTEHPDWGEQGAQAAREYVATEAVRNGVVEPDPELEGTTQRQRDRALHLDLARAELAQPLLGEAIRQHQEQLDHAQRLIPGLREQTLPPEQGGTSDVKTLAEAHPVLGGRLIVQAFLAEWHDFKTAAENAPSPNADYHRWQGHMEARRQLAERLGVIL